MRLGNGQAIEVSEIAVVPAEEFRRVVLREVAGGRRITALFGHPQPGGRLRVYAVLAGDGLRFNVSRNGERLADASGASKDGEGAARVFVGGTVTGREGSGMKGVAGMKASGTGTAGIGEDAAGVGTVGGGTGASSPIPAV